MQIGVPKESVAGERRVALVPEAVRKLAGQGHKVVVEREAGAAAMIPDAQFEEAGATLADDAAEVF
jgi:alanine dehydrogenase